MKHPGKPTRSSRQQTRSMAEYAGQTGDGWLPIIRRIADRFREPDVLIDEARALWAKTQNPVFVWRAIQICEQENIPYANWIRQYLAGCAKRMFDASEAKKFDLRRALPKVLGFTMKRGPGNLLRPDADNKRYMAAAARFMRGIREGKNPRVALHGAFEVLDAETSDGLDDSTLLRHIMRSFGTKTAPEPTMVGGKSLRHASSRPSARS
jgi:hypothetical protein